MAQYTQAYDSSRLLVHTLKWAKSDYTLEVGTRIWLPKHAARAELPAHSISAASQMTINP
jgi:hypothetical protein